MKTFTLSIFLLCFMLSSALYTKNVCLSCHTIGSEVCKHVEEECPGNSSCMIMSEEFGNLGNITRSILKRCARNLPCDTYFYASAGPEVFIKLFLVCCNGKGCNTANFHLPKIDPQAKGILCPVCHAYGTWEGCIATTSSICPGKDDLCIRFRGNMRLPGGPEVKFSAQGCSSKTVCESDFSEMIGLGITKIIESTCYVPTSPYVHETLPKI